jgi:hypothetical protein
VKRLNRALEVASSCPELPRVAQILVVKAKRDEQAPSLIRHEAVIRFRFFGRFFNRILIAFLETLFYCDLKL